MGKEEHLTKHSAMKEKKNHTNYIRTQPWPTNAGIGFQLVL